MYVRRNSRNAFIMLPMVMHGIKIIFSKVTAAAEFSHVYAPRYDILKRTVSNFLCPTSLRTLLEFRL